MSSGKEILGRALGGALLVSTDGTEKRKEGKRTTTSQQPRKNIPKNGEANSKRRITDHQNTTQTEEDD